MTVGYLLLLLAVAGFSLLGIFHKVADAPECRPRTVAAILFFWGAVLTALYTAFFDPNGLTFGPAVLMIGGLGGIFSALAIFAFQSGLRHGKISTSWLVINLSMSLPIFVSLAFYGESLNWVKAVGILLVVTAIVFMWLDKRIDAHAGEAHMGHAKPLLIASKWLPLMILAFVANGLAASSQKVLVESGLAEFTWQFYTVLYTSGFLLMFLLTAFRGERPRRLEMTSSLVMGVCSVLGNISLTLSLAHAVPGAVAFAVGNGGSLTLVVLAGILFFREKIHSVGVVGILCGITAILVLVMEPTLLNFLKPNPAVP